MKITKNSLRQMIMEELASLSEYGWGQNPDADSELHGEHNDSEDPQPEQMSFLDTLDKGGRQIPGEYEKWFASLPVKKQANIKADADERNAAAAASNKWRTSGKEPWRPTDQDPK